MEPLPPPTDSCKPSCEFVNSILGKAGTGAVLSLDAIGLQDTYLISNSNSATSNITESFFQFKNIQHTNFTKYSASIEINNFNIKNWPFNQVVNVNMRPKEMGDILNNMYLKCTLPDLTGFGLQNAQYCANVGFAMINKIQIQLDDIILEIIQCDWNIIYSELYYTRNEKAVVSQMVNCVDPFKGGPLYIPLEFFFSRRHSTTFTDNPLADEKYFKPGFLTCAASNHRNLQITITFNPITFFCSHDVDITLDKMYLVTDEVVLDDRERQYLQNNTQKNMISFTRNESVTPVVVNPFTANLTPQISIKIMHWFMRNTKYEDVSDPAYYQDRFNFSSNKYAYINPTYISLTQEVQETTHPIISQSILYLNGVQSAVTTFPVTTTYIQDGSYYYKFIVPLSHSLTVPAKNIYTYSFCTQPKDPQPSGSLDFSQMNSTTTFLNGSVYIPRDPITPLIGIPPFSYNLYIYYVGYNQITYKDGLVSLSFGW